MGFYPFQPAAGGGAVDSVFGRTGTVTAETGDYTAAQVTGAVAQAVPTGDVTGAGDLAVLNAAVAALPATGGTVLMEPGNWYLVPGAFTVELANTQPVVIDGQWGAVVNAVGGTAGEVIAMYNPANQGGDYNGNAFSMRSGVRGLLIDGTSADAGSTGLRLGDVMNAQVDVIVQNFSGAGDIGAHFLNSVTWTEQADVKVASVNCTTAGVLEVTSGATSFGYCAFDFSVQAYPGQTGVHLLNGANPYNGSLRIRGNFGAQAALTGTPAVLAVTGVAPAGGDSPGSVSSMFAQRLDVNVECNAGAGTAGPYTIYADLANSAFINNCSGQMNFQSSGGDFTGSNMAGGGSFQFNGSVAGDDNLLPNLFSGSVIYEAPLAIGNYATPQALATGDTIALTGNSLPVSAAAAATGIILTAGSGALDGQVIAIYNTGNNAVTFAAAGTSNVSNGAGCTIPAGEGTLFQWAAVPALWYPLRNSAA